MFSGSERRGDGGTHSTSLGKYGRRTPSSSVSVRSGQGGGPYSANGSSAVSM